MMIANGCTSAQLKKGRLTFRVARPGGAEADPPVPRCAVATAEMNRFLPVVTEFLPSAQEAGTSVEEVLHRFSPDGPTGDQSDHS